MDGTTTCGSTSMSTRHKAPPKGRFVPRADSIRPYNPYGKLIPFIEPLCPETGRGDYWPTLQRQMQKHQLSQFLVCFQQLSPIIFSFSLFTFSKLEKSSKKYFTSLAN